MSSDKDGRRPTLAATPPALHGARLIGAPRHPLLVQLRDYWQGKCGPDGRLPGRADIDPLELRSLLPQIFLIDAALLPDGSHDYRVRLMGTAHSGIYGDGHVGKRLQDMFGDYAPVFTTLYDQICRAPRCYSNEGRIFWWRNAEFIAFEGFHAPLASDGRQVDMVLGAAVFDYGKAG